LPSLTCSSSHPKTLRFLPFPVTLKLLQKDKYRERRVFVVCVNVKEHELFKEEGCCFLGFYMCFRGTCFLRFCIPGKLRQVGFFDLVTHAE
jgi:hypothetical protein